MSHTRRSATLLAGRKPIRDWAARLWARWVLMCRAVETRRELGRLDARLLADMGVGRAEAAREAERWPWDLEPSGTPGRTIKAGPGSRNGNAPCASCSPSPFS